MPPAAQPFVLRLATLLGVALVLSSGPAAWAGDGDAPPASEERISFPFAGLDVLGGDNQVAALAVSADGRYLAMGQGVSGTSGEVRVVSLPDHKEVLRYATPGGVASVAFAPDGRHLASADYAGQAVLRQFPSGRTKAILRLDGPGRVAFLGDGRTFVTVSEMKTIGIHETATGRLLRRIDGTTFWYCLAVSRDGRYLATGGGNLGAEVVRDAVTIWDAETMQPVGLLEGQSSSVMCVGFSADGKTIATGTEDGVTEVWQFDGLKKVAALRGHEDRVKALGFSPDGRTLATGSHDGSVLLWDLATRQSRERLEGHVAPIRSLAVAPDGRTLFTGGAGRMLRVWDLPGGAERAVFQPNATRPESASLILATAFSPDGATLATAHEDGRIHLRNPGGDILRTLLGHEDAVTCLAFSRDGKTLVSASFDRTVRVWDVAGGKERAVLRKHTGWVTALALAPDGRTLASAGYDRVVRLWDLDRQEETATLPGHRGAVRALAFASDGRTLASGGVDRVVRLWDLETRQCRELPGHDGAVRVLAYAPDGQTLVSGSEDGTVRLWKASGEPKGTLKGHADAVTALAFSPRGDYLVSGAADAGLFVWHLRQSQDKPAQNLAGPTGAVSCLAWAPAGQRLVAAGSDGSMKGWIAQVSTEANLDPRPR